MLESSSDYVVGWGMRCVLSAIHMLCEQGQNKFLVIRVFATLFSEIILYMYIKVLVICLYPVGLLRDTSAYT
jgi:hypothetical protein